MQCIFEPASGRCHALGMNLRDSPLLVLQDRPSPAQVQRILERDFRVEVCRGGQALAWAATCGRPWTYRLAPLIPCLDDDLASLEAELEAVAAQGCDHVVVGLARAQDLPSDAPAGSSQTLSDAETCREYRFRLFSLLRGLCDWHRLTFAPLDREFIYLCNREPCCRAIEGTLLGK